MATRSSLTSCKRTTGWPGDTVVKLSTRRRLTKTVKRSFDHRVLAVLAGVIQRHSAQIISRLRIFQGRVRGDAALVQRALSVQILLRLLKLHPGFAQRALKVLGFKTGDARALCDQLTFADREVGQAAAHLEGEVHGQTRLNAADKIAHGGGLSRLDLFDPGGPDRAWSSETGGALHAASTAARPGRRGGEVSLGRLRDQGDEAGFYGVALIRG
jgi:hypothetical protein